ncbi:MAG: CHAT domain-containing protein [Planctomycetales bacterium]|nr:CHAT domain-containing protein [Planctomycetales bacterium]
MATLIDRASCWRCLAAIGVLAVALHCPTSALAQLAGGKVYPNSDFDLALRPFYSGEYSVAERAFKDASRGAIRSVNVLWVDSVCYRTMQAECYYHIGDLDNALLGYNEALQIYLSNPQWVTRLQFRNDGIQPGLLERITWGPKGRNTAPGRFPGTINSVQTSLNIGTVGQGDQQQQAISQQQTLYPLRVDEVLRCTALALARRAEILGPVCSRDELSSKIERQIAGHRVPNGHWSQPLFGVCSALGKLGTGQADEAYAQLQRSLTFGQFDHTLTGRALLEMGKIHLAKGELEPAEKHFYEATFPAADFGHLDVLEEAIKFLTIVHRVKSPDQPLPVLDQINAWARANRFSRINASASVEAAYWATCNHDSKNAAQYLADAQRAMARTNLMSGDLGARFQFVSAAAGFLDGRTRQAEAAFRTCMKQQAKSSPDLYRIAWVLNQAKQGLRESTITAMLRRVMQAPSDQMWQIEPMAALTLDEAPLLNELEYWLELEIKQDHIDQVIAIADRIRAKKFTSTAPLTGRRVSLRWLLEAADPLVSDEAKLQKQAIMAAFPQWQEASKEVARLQSEMRRLPVLPTDPDQLKTWQEITSSIRKVSTQQEEMLDQISLYPMPSHSLFPPIRSLDEIQTGLQPGQAVIDVISTKRQTTFVLLTKDGQYETLGSSPAGREQRAVMTTLKAFGNNDSKNPVLASQLSSSTWQSAAKQMYTTVFGNRASVAWATINELIVVPDGQYWYVPFEALAFDDAGDTQPLISACRIRYVPMASMAVSDPRPHVATPSTFVVAGRIYGQRTSELANEITANDGNAAVAAKLIPVSSSEAGSRWDRLIVLDEIEGTTKDPFGWLPAQADGKVPQSKLTDWMLLPWAAPQQIILPGFDTAASGPPGKNATGDEMLQTSLGLLSTGCRTVLISRWRSGGQMAQDIVREFLSQLGDDSPAGSLQRAIDIVRSSPIDPELEPRVKSASEDNLPTGEHPFFWASYQLIDLGQPAAVAP